MITLSEEQKDYFKSLDFMRIGQAVSRQQWQSAAMIVRRMDLRAKELGIDMFDRQFVSLRQCVNRREKAECQQILAVIVSKRASVLNEINRRE